MPFDPERYAAGLRRENERERETIALEASRAREEAARIATQIGSADSNVRSVYLFGSLASGEPRSRDFDIDLAIEGGDVFAAEEVAEAASFPVDVVALDRVPKATRERILASGRRLYSRSS
ncbi:MAG TPA: nucleotidyltransferase domain-containing protein [Spirochaetia bacterium]|nr:nucleotidyltransferase domain-containing protein [Spirochaetia bacterium]